ncbi:MAG: BlaI/MecI/CopY family transcriptional regulator [Wenzhouxiangella sp.]|nr:BlaI/MecI/CopY family transcriptional regulator [Wenzhouxiangella sp.]MCH8479413.1 BlaI/MecI/CopY family transcriptional regulator [Wenzhouxiangella sp.]
MHITDAERKIMECLWQQHPATASELIDKLDSSTDWRQGTVKALLNRLLNKGAIKASRSGRRFLYSPAVSREQCVSEASQRFLDRWFDGRLAPLVAHLSDHRRIKPAELDELKALIADIEDES